MKIVGITAEFRVEDLGSTVGAVAFQKLRLRSVEARKLEHGFRRISARIPYTLP